MKLKALFLAVVLTVSASATSTLGLYCEDEQLKSFTANDEYINSSTNWAAGANPSSLKYNKKNWYSYYLGYIYYSSREPSCGQFKCWL